MTLQVTGNAPASVNPSIALYPSDRTVDSEVSHSNGTGKIMLFIRNVKIQLL